MFRHTKIRVPRTTEIRAATGGRSRPVNQYEEYSVCLGPG